MVTPSLTTVTVLCSLTVPLSSFTLGVQIISGIVQVVANVKEVTLNFIFSHFCNVSLSTQEHNESQIFSGPVMD